MTTLLNTLEQRGARYGLQVMCEAGGQANATIIERFQVLLSTPTDRLGSAVAVAVQSVAAAARSHRRSASTGSMAHLATMFDIPTGPPARCWGPPSTTSASWLSSK
jgi:hypothetical protein